MTRQCARPGCSAYACATLAYDYHQRVTWIDPLADESHPMAYDLCHDHAQALTVPRGWRLEDRRPADDPGYGDHDGCGGYEYDDRYPQHPDDAHDRVRAAPPYEDALTRW